MFEYVTQYGPPGALVALAYLLIELLKAWWVNRSDKSRLLIEKAQTEIEQRQADSKRIEVLMSALESAVATIQALQTQMTGLQNATVEQNKVIIDLQNQSDRFRDDLIQSRSDANKATTQIGNELLRVKGQLKQANDRIAELERQLAAKDQQIAELRAELEKSEQSRQTLQAEIEGLTTRLNGKVDKVTEEPGEGMPTAPVETKEEK